ncbi:RNA polymerase sigma factor [Paraburkholderia caballeronis]|uniref:DNA-directed RNA polymerase specialized sigma subunit, sigma24 family n=1 Tax=Paraburkholderia caballeronis TaxID=416943 RepID=A0A1H7NZD5_9BURK|nr:hypothetical protein [Paraburkholderia caballeronis]PXW25457.1 DNA-directed RNA polymerase specialized sigma24 family protein [Paraburkholderia caballeronis]PXX01064.1 DNA-directed RNA polymerase specialized sigma24 family protein [Paraburkholderia caballeronis]RAJ99583.1 DNA-directed RNA polymerase specialized sigma24 family protein [Paraburkholderia caballeronis]TDV11438.1 DNA-directed RNA polymerase specialized sigma24 family protein [Paraburkholderia caballeronis]TDV14628.1 DNA-directed
MDYGANLAIRQLIADRVHFRDFFLALRKDVFRVARRRFPWVRDADVEECLHEAVLYVLEGRGDFDVPPEVLHDRTRLAAQLGAYIRSAATYRLIDRLTRLGHETRVTVRIDDDEHPTDLLDALLAQAGHVPPSVEGDIERRERLRILGDCLLRLTALARQTIELALLGHSDVDIQVATGAGSAVAVRRRISETKNVLARCAQSSLRSAA